MLSCYTSTIFFYLEGTTLYMSPNYSYKDNVLEATHAWLQLVLEIASEDKMVLPVPDYEWYAKVEEWRTW